MTTITNFLNGNFISANNSEIEKERPVWVLVSRPQFQTHHIRDYLTSQYLSKNMPMIHLDLGISQIKKYNENTCEEIELESGIKLLKPMKDKSYYFLKWRSLHRQQKHCLQKLSKDLVQMNKSEVMKKEQTVNNLPGFLKNSYGLFVEGIQLMTGQSDSQKQVESFINQLSNLPPCFKELIVFTRANTLNKQISFALERVSTCLTTINNYNPVSVSWKCLSTVRRFTGYSNQEEYVIKKMGKHLKVEKWVDKVEKTQTKEQKEMVDSLNFVVKKDEEEKKRLQELKKIIYPHLRVQEMCECGKQSCGKCTGDQELDLIVLDEEQEDEDDLDV